MNDQREHWPALVGRLEREGLGDMRVFGWVTVLGAFAGLALGMGLVAAGAIGPVAATVVTVAAGWGAMAGLLILMLQARVEELERQANPPRPPA